MDLCELDMKSSYRCNQGPFLPFLPFLELFHQNSGEDGGRLPLEQVILPAYSFPGLEEEAGWLEDFVDAGEVRACEDISPTGCEDETPSAEERPGAWLAEAFPALGDLPLALEIGPESTGVGAM